MENRFPRRQFIFLDVTFLGTVEVGGAATFDVAEGEHQVIAADSLDPADNAATEPGSFEAGFSYKYVVFGGS